MTDKNIKRGNKCIFNISKFLFQKSKIWLKDPKMMIIYWSTPVNNSIVNWMMSYAVNCGWTKWHKSITNWLFYYHSSYLASSLRTVMLGSFIIICWKQLCWEQKFFIMTTIDHIDYETIISPPGSALRCLRLKMNQDLLAFPLKKL